MENRESPTPPIVNRQSSIGNGVAVLALQGDFEAHRRKLGRMEIDSYEARRPAQIRGAAGLVLPGGESTTLWKFFQLEPWVEEISRFVASGRPVLATCAGAIVLAREVINPRGEGMGLIDIAVERNAYGRQADSFIATVEAPALGGDLPAVFIRAPKIRRVGTRRRSPRDAPGRAGARPAGQRRRGDLSSGADGGRSRARALFRLEGPGEKERMSPADLKTEERGGVAVVTLDRPPANAFTPELVELLRAALRQRSGSGAVVLASANPGLFSAGWDLPRISALDRAGMRDYLESYCDLVREIFTFPGPVIAALPGHAIAGGLIVATAADERFAADGAGRFGLSEIALGVPLPACCLELFAYVLGARRMERLTASAEIMPAGQALGIGLLDRVVPAGDVLDAAVERAGQLARGSAAAYAEVKRRARADAVARFDAARKDDPFLEFWFSPDARRRIAALIERLTKKREAAGPASA